MKYPQSCAVLTVVSQALYLINKAKRIESWSLQQREIRRLVQVSCSCYIYHDTFTPALSAGNPCKGLCLYPRRQEAVASPQSHLHVASFMPSFLSPGLKVNERLPRSVDSIAFKPAEQEVWQQFPKGRSAQCSCSHLLIWGASPPPSSPAKQGTAETAGKDWQLLNLLSMGRLMANCLLRNLSPGSGRDYGGW